MQLVALNIFDTFDFYYWASGEELKKQATLTKIEVVRRIAQGQEIQLLCVQTQQHTKLWATKKRGACYLRTDNMHQSTDCFFIPMDAPRLNAVEKDVMTPWAERP